MSPQFTDKKLTSPEWMIIFSILFVVFPFVGTNKISGTSLISKPQTEWVCKIKQDCVPKIFSFTQKDSPSVLQNDLDKNQIFVFNILKRNDSLIKTQFDALESKSRSFLITTTFLPLKVFTSGPDEDNNIAMSV